MHDWILYFSTSQGHGAGVISASTIGSRAMKTWRTGKSEVSEKFCRLIFLPVDKGRVGSAMDTVVRGTRWKRTAIWCREDQPLLAQASAQQPSPKSCDSGVWRPSSIFDVPPCIVGLEYETHGVRSERTRWKRTGAGLTPLEEPKSSESEKASLCGCETASERSPMAGVAVRARSSGQNQPLCRWEGRSLAAICRFSIDNIR